MELKKLFLSTTIGLAMFSATAQTLPVTAGLVTHLDASKITGVANGAKISTWADASGSSNDAIAMGATGQPTYVASSATFNSKPTLYFDGTDDWMDLKDVIKMNSFTGFVVANSTDNSRESYILSGLDRTGSVAGFDGKNRFRIAQFDTNAGWKFRFGNSQAFNGPKADDKAHTFTITSDGAGWVDDEEKNGKNTDASAVTTPNMRLGCIEVLPEAAKDFHIGEIAEVIFYNKLLTDAEITSVQAYLKAKYFATAGVKDFVNNVNFKVYPNPTENKVTINADNGFTIGAKLSVYDVTGRVLINKTLTESTSVIDLSKLASGSYLMKISKDGKSLVKQISRK